MRLSRASLTTKLIASVVALFVAVTALTGATTVLLMQRQLVQQIDQELQQSVAPLRGPHGDRASSEACSRDARGPGPGNGSLRACYVSGSSTGYVVSSPETATALTTAQLDQIDAAGVSGTPQTVEVEGIGAYRAVSVRTDDGVTIVAGQPVQRAAEATRSLLTSIAATSLAGLAATVLLGSWLIRRNLAPLRRVAATANRVSRLELDSGEVALAERVPQGDTDPRTEVGQVGSALNSMLDNVSGALEARQRSESRVRQFVADASHELRTPLASIRGYAELSRREQEPVPASVQHALGRVESEALRMQGLVEDLLLLARLDSGRPLDREPVDLTMIAITAVGDITAAAPERLWRLDLPDEPVEVVGDEGRLRQVLVNLLGNARAHTPAGTTVTTSLRAEADAVVMRVADDGPGIPEHLQADVFERFTRGDDSRNRAAGSTGLGLSIVQSVVQAHDGRVSLTSRPGETVVEVRLPR